ncbi:MAG: DUF86 domain-containing protein [Actinomycetota bacterium]|nr:DUF86 domain-containing protein [Actinomycetota bacterium]
MVDEARVRRLLQGVTDDLTLLAQRALLDRGELLGDIDRLAAVKYFFVTAIEGCVDVAHHLCASESWAAPASNADAFRILVRHGVLEGQLGARLARAAGFRNVLVHEYVTVDDCLVVDNLDRLDDLAAFVDAVVAWVDELGSA